MLKASSAKILFQLVTNNDDLRQCKDFFAMQTKIFIFSPLVGFFINEDVFQCNLQTHLCDLYRWNSLMQALRRLLQVSGPLIIFI